MSTTVTLKAIRVHQTGDPSVLKFEDHSLPQPTDDQVLIAVRAVGVNPVETYIRSGNYGPVSTPYTPGHDAAGVVEAVGTKVSKVKVGQRVYTIRTISGAYAERLLAREGDVYPLHDSLSFEQGTALGVAYGTAQRALFQRGSARAGETVLIHGASGGVGTAAIQLAKHGGLRVFATAGTEEGLRLVESLGSDRSFNHKNADYLKAIREAAPNGVDVVLEMLANVNMDKDLGLLARRGRVVVVGSRGRIEIDPRTLMGIEGDIRGMALYSALPEETAAIYEAINAAVSAGAVKPIIGRAFKLAEASKAHEEVIAQTGGASGKIVLTVD